MIAYYVAEAADAHHAQLVEEAEQRRRARRASGRSHPFAAFWRRGWLGAPSTFAPRYQEPGYRSTKVLNGSYGPAGTSTRHVPADRPVLEPHRPELPEQLTPLARGAELPAPARC